jgi:hypothetical protein
MGYSLKPAEQTIKHQAAETFTAKLKMAISFKLRAILLTTIKSSLSGPIWPMSIATAP